MNVPIRRLPTLPAARPALAAALVAAIPLVFPAGLRAQSAEATIRYGDPVRLPVAEEIALARSAAPAAVSADATVLVLEERGTRWVTAVEGTNGSTCYVDRTWEGSLEPMCFDPEGSRTTLKIQVARSEMGLAGASEAEIDGAIEEGLAAGRLRHPSRPAMAYMLSSAQVLYNDEGKRVGAWKPHLMLYWPGLTKADIGGVGEGPLVGPSVIMIDEGTDDAMLIIVQPEFVEPAAVVAAAE
jgi:hypothetical protein